METILETHIEGSFKLQRYETHWEISYINQTEFTEEDILRYQGIRKKIIGTDGANVLANIPSNIKISKDSLQKVFNSTNLNEFNKLVFVTEEMEFCHWALYLRIKLSRARSKVEFHYTRENALKWLLGKHYSKTNLMPNMQLAG